MNNVTFLGTSHIAKQSLDEVEHHILNGKPDIVAIELDNKRLPALMSNEKSRITITMIRHIGIKGYLFALLGAWAEKKMGKLVGVAPGSEMKKAVILAKKQKIQIALVDQEIDITLQRLSKAITWKEKRKFIGEIFKALFSRKREIDFDLRTVPEAKIIKKLTEKLRKDYPNIYRVLIEERNHVIAKKVQNLIKFNPDKKILVILGAGHIEDVKKLIGKEDKSEEPNYSYSFTVN
ncbi:MAG TPA: TraB/GumN family protein [Candidatus Nanoarchaeia archaeon]|nr:TraB/GumN family protein [Candidatus Nanoarchaeia archaeon]